MGGSSGMQGTQEAFCVRREISVLAQPGGMHEGPQKPLFMAGFLLGGGQ